jgi:hypothetical protein
MGSEESQMPIESKRAPDAWIAMLSQEECRELGFAGGPYDFGFVAGMARLIRTHPRIGQAFGRLFAEIMFAPGALTRRERELVAGVASAAQDCFY